MARNAVQQLCLQLIGPPRAVKRLVERGDVKALCELLRQRPLLLASNCYGCGNTLLHLIAKHGKTALLVAVLQLAAELHLTRSSKDVQQGGAVSTNNSIYASSSRQAERYAPFGCVPSLRSNEAGGRSRAANTHHANAQLSQAALLNALNAAGQTPIMLAAMGGHSDLVLALVKRGVRLDIAEKSEGCTVLHYAARFGFFECCTFLLHANASDQPAPVAAHMPAAAFVDAGHPAAATSRGPVQPPSTMIHMLSRGGASALHYASDAGHAEIVKLLLEHGADVTAGVRPAGRFAWMASHQGATPLHLAAARGHMTVMLAILRHAAESHMTVDPRTLVNRAGLRPHQVAHLIGHYRAALALRPGHPLALGLPSHAWSSPVAPLARIAATALKSSLLASLQAATVAAAPSSYRSASNGTCVDPTAGTPVAAGAHLEGSAASDNSSAAVPQVSCAGGEICAAGAAVSELPACGVCLEEAGAGGQQLLLVQLRPCAHRLCAQCAGMLCEGVGVRPALCPFCRTHLCGFQA